MPEAKLSIGTDGAELVLLAGNGKSLCEAFEITTRPRSWARAQISEWGWKVTQWRKVEDGVFVTDVT